MENHLDIQKRNFSNKFMAGLIILLAGLVLLFQQLDFFFFPHWLISWPMLLIVLGFYTGFRHNFHNFSWFVLVFIGSVFLLNRILPGLYLTHFIWPIGIIALGVWLIIRRNDYMGQNRWNKL
jgi:hypothetical protein